MRKIFIALFSLLLTGNSYAGQIANVEYIHLMIQKKWNIWIDYSQDLNSPQQAANMEYLMYMVDLVNARVNGFASTTSNAINYGTNPVYATKQAVDTVAVNNAINTLVKELPGFAMVTMSNTSKFGVFFRANGNFHISWGGWTNR